MKEIRINNSNIYYSQQVVNDPNIFLSNDKYQILKIIEQNNINSLSKFILENITLDITNDYQHHSKTFKYSVAILPVNEYKRLKEIEEKMKFYNFID